MPRHRKIPVIKNRGIVIRKKKKTGLRNSIFLILVLGLMLLYVWLKVETNLALQEIEQLEIQQAKLAAENQKLHTREIAFSDFSRIQRIATKELNLQFAAPENVIEIAQQ
ncbi:MAG: cell division protein FtsL [Calditrichaeota bacterium]|nr:cell division protein FtsL [Calditrichota bacterium]